MRGPRAPAPFAANAGARCVDRNQITCKPACIPRRSIPDGDARRRTDVRRAGNALRLTKNEALPPNEYRSSKAYAFVTDRLRPHES